MYSASVGKLLYCRHRSLAEPLATNLVVASAPPDTIGADSTGKDKVCTETAGDYWPVASSLQMPSIPYMSFVANRKHGRRPEAATSSL